MVNKENQDKNDLVRILNNENSNRLKPVNPDWKQWIPVYGFGQVIYDKIHNKPTLDELHDKNGKPHIIRWPVSSGYHSITTFYPIYKLIESLF